MFKPHTKVRSGFTLIEMALSVALLGIIFGMTMPMYHTFSVRNDLDIATFTVVQSLRRAQVLSQVSDGDSSWGVRVSSGSILIYKGSSFILREEEYDENTSIPTTILISGLQDVVFSKQTGLPQNTGTVSLTSSSNETRNVTINQKGMVDY